MIRASSRSVPGATALPKWRPQRPEMRSFRKRSRQSLTVSTLQDWLRLTAAKAARQTQDDPSSSHIIGSGGFGCDLCVSTHVVPQGLNLKGAGMKKTIHQDRQMSLLQCTSPTITCSQARRRLSFEVPVNIAGNRRGIPSNSIIAPSCATGAEDWTNRD